MSQHDTDVASVEAQLSQLSQPNVHLYVLIDLANVATEAPLLHKWLSASSAVCVFGDPSAAALLASPWLMALAYDGSAQTLRKKTIELALRSSAVTWLSSALATPELARRLRARTEVRLPDRYEALLRHFDPRVLPVLHQTLTAPQREVFFKLGTAWLFVDRASALNRITLMPAPEIDEFAAPLDLDSEQYVALLDAAEVDAVMPELVKEEPDRFLALGNGTDRYRFTRHWMSRAHQWKLDHFHQKVVFCTLALRFGAGFDEQPMWQQALSRVAVSGARLSEAIEQALAASSSERGDQHAV